MTRKNNLLLLLLSLLLTVACLPVAIPNTPTTTLSPTPSPVPTLAHTPPSHTAPPFPDDHAQALRPEFAADLALFPDATRYEIELTIDLDTPAVTGREHASYTNTEDIALDALYLRLFPNTPGYGGQMAVTDVLLNDVPVEPVTELDGSALRLPLNPPLEPGARLDLTLDFTVALPTQVGAGYRQFGYYDGILALTNIYPLIPVYDEEGWNIEVAPTYGDAVYSETSFYSVRINAPAEMTLFASGVCAPPTFDSDNVAAWTCVAGPMRDFNAILGPDYRVKSDVVEGCTINSIFYSDHSEGGEWALDQATEAVRIFTDLFGPYPFTELDVVETPTSAGGIEYPGLIVINSAYYESLGEDMEWVVVHETGHQWWYSLVGNDQVDDPWLDEALVQYSTLLYYEERYGAELAADLVDEVFRRPYEGLTESGRDAPAGMPVAAYDADDYGTVVYRKGPLYFHELRREVGDEDFGAIVQTYFNHNRYAVARPEDWLTAVESVTGDEHHALYEQWIMGATEP